MKKIILLVVVLMAFIGQSTLWAQEQGKIRAGLGLSMGTKAALDSDTGESKLGFGITVGGDYFITDAIVIAPNFTFFFKSSVQITGFDFSQKVSNLDIDGKYYFLNDAVGVYGLFGLSLGFSTVEGVIDLSGFQPIPFDESDSMFGVNIGGGADYYLSDKVFLNAQLKWNTPLEQLAINIGAGFNIN